MSEPDLIAARRANLAALRSHGFDPFATLRFPVTDHAVQVLDRYRELTADAEPPTAIHMLAGRVMSVRTAGKTCFADLVDRSGKVQIYLRKDDVGDEAFAAFKTLDLGDSVGVEGVVFRSKMGELTLRVKRFAALGKALLPLPDKWHGLTDVEKRYRQRYVDLMMNKDVRDTFIVRSRIVSEMRRFIDSRGFLELETPTLLQVAGGAAARPFRTRSNALDMPLDMRIATELNLKRCIVGGLERVYEIGRIFRNEGIDSTHNPEFTMLELYCAYWSKDDMLAFNEELIRHLVVCVNAWKQRAPGPPLDALPAGVPDEWYRLPCRRVAGLARGDDATAADGAPAVLDFKPKFRIVRYLDAMREHGGLARADLLEGESCRRIAQRETGIDSPTHAHALDKLFEKFVEPALFEPTFVIDYPLVLSPLAKRLPDDPQMTDRYELFCANFEIANAFSELNDPDDQRARFEAQMRERAAGDDEVPPPDWDFVTALEYGMPATAGIGIGVDRLIMLLTDNVSIRDVLLFPLQRPLAPSPAAETQPA